MLTAIIIAAVSAIALSSLAFLSFAQPHRWFLVEREAYARWSRLAPERKLATLRAVQPSTTVTLADADLDAAFQKYLLGLRREHQTLDHEDLRLHLDSLVPLAAQGA